MSTVMSFVRVYWFEFFSSGWTLDLNTNRAASKGTSAFIETKSDLVLQYFLLLLYVHCFENGGIKNWVVYLISFFQLRYLGWTDEDLTSHLPVVPIYLVSEEYLRISIPVPFSHENMSMYRIPFCLVSFYLSTW